MRKNRVHGWLARKGVSTLRVLQKGRHGLAVLALVCLGAGCMLWGGAGEAVAADKGARFDKHVEQTKAGTSQGGLTRKGEKSGAGQAATAAQGGPPPADLRVAYVQGGDMEGSADILWGLSRGLRTLGLMECQAPRGGEEFTVHETWEWLATHCTGRVRFVPDAFYDGRRDIALRADNKTVLRQRARTKGDVNVILALGTPGGLDMATDMEPAAVLVVDSTDPVGAGIVRGVEFSGRPNVHAVVENARYFKQLEMFHNIFPFRRLGLCYESSPEWRSIIAYNDIRRASKELGFELVEALIADFTQDEVHNTRLRSQCHQRLAGQVDAVYLTMGPGNSRRLYKELLTPLLVAKVPTFAQEGELAVKAGALLGFCGTNVDELGIFEARVFQQLLDGKRPNQISQIYDNDDDVALNIRNASLIGWKIPSTVLASVDHIFENIQTINR